MPTPLPRPGPTDYQDAPGTELDLVWDELCDVVEATEATANAALPATQAAAGTLIAAAADKATPVDADSLALSDSAAGGILRRFSWASLKAALNGVFARLAGVSGGQTLIGGTASGENLTLQSTAHATRGKLLLGTSAYDEAANRLGIGVFSPTAALHLKAGSASASTAPLKLQDGSLLTTPEAGAIEQQAGRLYHTDADAVRRGIATESFVFAVANNLIANGAGELLNNRNWSTYTFDAADTYATPGSFRINVAQAVHRSDQLIPVDTTQRLRQTLWAKSGDIGGANYNAANRQYFATDFYDIDGLQIDSAHADKVAGSTETTLALPLNPGDTTITLTDATGWYNSTSASNRGFVWFGYANSKGYVYPDYTYSRNRLSDAWASGGISGNVITLKVPWAGPALPAGAAVRNSGSGATFRYNILSNGIVPNAWTRYEGVLTGVGAGIATNFRFGTAFIKFGHLVNYHGAADNNVRLADIRFNNLSSANLEPQIGIGATYKDLLPASLPTNGLAVEGRAGFGTSTPAAAVHVLGTTEQVRIGYDANDYMGFTVASDGKVAMDIVGSAGGCKLSYSDGTSNAVHDLLTLSKNRNTGAGAAGLGVRVILAAESTTTTDTAQGAIESTWAAATHASRRGRLTLSAYDTDIREGLRIEASGTVPMLGFFGVAAVVRPTALTAQLTTLTHTAPGTPDYAIQSLTNASGYGFVTADEGATVLSVIKNLQDRVAQLETKLQALGLLT